MAAFPKKTKHRPKHLLISLFCLSLSLILLVFSFRPNKSPFDDVHVDTDYYYKSTTPPSSVNPTWHDIIQAEFGDQRVKIGLVNIDHECTNRTCPNSLFDTVRVSFVRVSGNLTWTDLFPEWIDEDHKWGPPICPKIPLPPLDHDYTNLDVIVAKLPCEDENNEKEGIRDVYRLQVNLAVANLAAASSENRTVYILFEGECEPMGEVFRCDDMKKRVGDYRVYKPDLLRLKQRVDMPFGSCQIASHDNNNNNNINIIIALNITGEPTSNRTRRYKREAYATLLHSSETYVCGAVALAQSIKQQNSTKELLLFHDESISDNSLKLLESAGWRLWPFSRIRSPFSKKGSYNEYNYSKLRIWQMTKYTKFIFIDADVLVLKNLDRFFSLPELSAATNDGHLFNSGLMVVEPSMCAFEKMMLKSFKLNSYNGGDQGFLNEIFTWWHRLPKKINYLKDYKDNDDKREIPDDLFAIHYLGIKPWMCYRDYDCNWDVVERHRFASDSAHRKWWEVYDKMPQNLQKFCGLTKEMDFRIRKWRGIARNASLPDGHWKIEPKDPRQYNLV
ncbi:hypothetical protein ACFE04_004908 [Oxalis oulophora]